MTDSYGENLSPLEYLATLDQRPAQERWRDSPRVEPSQARDERSEQAPAQTPARV